MKSTSVKRLYVGEKPRGEKSVGEESVGKKCMGEDFVGEKSAGEKSVGEKSKGAKSNRSSIHTIRPTSTISTSILIISAPISPIRIIYVAR